MKINILPKKEKKNWPLIIGAIISLISIPAILLTLLSSKPKAASKPKKKIKKRK
jgi:hypothetical protein